MTQQPPPTPDLNALRQRVWLMRQQLEGLETELGMRDATQPIPAQPTHDQSPPLQGPVQAHPQQAHPQQAHRPQGQLAGPRWSDGPRPPVAPRPPKPKGPAWHEREGAVAQLLAVIGAGVLLIGIVLLLAAGNNEVIPRVTAVAVAAILSATLLGAGVMLQRRMGTQASSGEHHNAGAVAMAATGFAGAYLTVAMSTSEFKWLNTLVGLLISAAIVALGLALARIWRSQSLHVIVVLGGSLLAPFVTANHHHLAAYAVAVSVGALAGRLPSVRWKVAEYARIVPPAIYLLAMGERPSDSVDPSVTAAVFAAVALVSAAHWWRQPGAEKDTTPTICAALAVCSTLPIFLIHGERWQSATTAAGVAAIAIAVWVMWRDIGQRGQTVLAVATGIYACITLYRVLPDQRLGTAALITGLVMLIVHIFYKSRSAGYAGLALGTVGFLANSSIVIVLLNQRLSMRLLTWWDLLDGVVALAVIWLLVHTRVSGDLDVDRSPALKVVAAVSRLIPTVALMVSAGVLLGRLMDAADTGWLVGQVASSIAWMATATWLLLKGREKYGRSALRVGLVLTGAALVKLIWFDIASLPGLYRVIAFFVVGLLMVIVGVMYANSRPNRGPQPANYAQPANDVATSAQQHPQPQWNQSQQQPQQQQWNQPQQWDQQPQQSWQRPDQSQ